MSLIKVYDCEHCLFLTCPVVTLDSLLWPIQDTWGKYITYLANVYKKMRNPYYFTHFGVPNGSFLLLLYERCYFDIHVYFEISLKIIQTGTLCKNNKLCTREWSVWFFSQVKFVQSGKIIPGVYTGCLFVELKHGYLKRNDSVFMGAKLRILALNKIVLWNSKIPIASGDIRSKTYFC